MNRNGLLNKISLILTIQMVVCFQFFGTYQLMSVSQVNAIVTEPLSPTVKIISPIDNENLNKPSVIFKGLVENFASLDGVTVTVYKEQVKIGETITDPLGNWEVTALLEEGNHSISVVASNLQATSNPASINITIDTIAPIITFTNPSEGEYINLPTIEGLTEPNSIVEICSKCSKDLNGDIIGTWDTIKPENISVDGKWTYQLVDFPDNTYTVYAKATDKAGNVGIINSVTFTLDQSNPIVLPDVFPKPNMTRVPIETNIIIKVSDNIRLSDTSITGIDQLITVSTRENGDTVLVEQIDYKPETGEIIFKPVLPLESGKKYHVLVNPYIKDAAGNISRPRMWSFTTLGDQTLQVDGNPHGHYQSNVNTCANCHSTHVAKSSKLLSDPKIEDKLGNYCMACHDGTLGAPMPEDWTKGHAHNHSLKVENSPTSVSCASCHNPHLDWSEGNPNRLQDHFSFDHTSIGLEGIPSSSKDQLCSTCHETNSYEVMINNETEYRVFKYNKSNTAIGLYEDYQLCLRCHNAALNQSIPSIANIADFYNNLTEQTKKDYETANGTPYNQREITAEEKSFSGHIIKAVDGSPLAGHIPCAECHETHGSNNIKQLKTKLGHENRKDFGLTIEFDIAAERDFCMKCHNNSTAIYGVTANFDGTTPSHSDIEKSCSTCHGGASKTLLEAAHAPKRPSPQ